jgi:hypothetical protein
VRVLAFVAFIVFTVSGAAGAYEVRTTNAGTPLRWAEGDAPFVIALDEAPDGVVAEAARSAASRAIATYQVALATMAPELHIQVHAIDGTVSGSSTDDGINVIRWVKSGWDDDYDPSVLAVTVTTYDAESGRITDADIAINAGDHHVWTAADDENACIGGYDLQNTLTHEMGHAFGLAHEKLDPQATMYPTANPCETSKRDLAAQDLGGLNFLYVVVGPADAGCAVGGGQGPRTTTLIVAALLVLVRLGRRSANRTAVLIGALALGSWSPALATTLVRLSLETMGARADLIVQGTVVAEEVTRRGARVYTDTSIGVTSCLRGSCVSAVTVRQPGGELGGRGAVVEGTARFAVGDEVVVFLRRRSDGAFAPVGMVQGVLRVERGADRSVSGYARDLRGVGFAGEDHRGVVERVRAEELRRALDTAAVPR